MVDRASVPELRWADPRGAVFDLRPVPFVRPLGAESDREPVRAQDDKEPPAEPSQNRGMVESHGVEVRSHTLEFVARRDSKVGQIEGDGRWRGLRVEPQLYEGIEPWEPKHVHDLVAHYTAARSSATVTDPDDGRQDTYVACDGGKRYSIVDPNMGSGQLEC